MTDKLADVRFVPMTEAQRDYLDSLPANDTLYAIVEAWDAAEPPAGWLPIDGEQARAIASADDRQRIADCPMPVFHQTHRYCPACPWTEASA